VASRQIYAVYHGEQNLGDGTADELAQRFNMQPETIRKLASPVALAKNKTGKRLIVIKLGKEKIK
jgi:hypothetical protein